MIQTRPSGPSAASRGAFRLEVGGWNPALMEYARTVPVSDSETPTKFEPVSSWPPQWVLPLLPLLLVLPAAERRSGLTGYTRAWTTTQTEHLPVVTVAAILGLPVRGRSRNAHAANDAVSTPCQVDQRPANAGRRARCVSDGRRRCS